MWDFVVRATEESPSGRNGTDSERQGMAVVLTTHSLDECEALCSRVGIMHQVSNPRFWKFVLLSCFMTPSFPLSLWCAVWACACVDGKERESGRARAHLHAPI
jgi:hypothetical protein